MKAETDNLRWWMVQGKEKCPFCLQIYLYEEEYRCIDCDSPVCPHCASRFEKSAQCPCCISKDKGE
ncbi:MAG: hypothetical protein SCH71_04325 [Desulfobulbaceae bacterium]|nr:hypothetical protein [Desulfobulbaceae bacterium]